MNLVLHFELFCVYVLLELVDSSNVYVSFKNWSLIVMTLKIEKKILG